MTPSDIDWASATTHSLSVIGGLAIGSTFHWLNEARRKIYFSAVDVHFGPAENYNNFVGRNCPHEDLIELTCEVRFFSKKTMSTGLHDFHIQFCQRTRWGTSAVTGFDHKSFYRDLEEKDGPKRLDTLVLHPREFVCFSITLHLSREYWPLLRLCDHVRLGCETVEGKRKRLFISDIRFPDMPDEAPRGIEFMSANVDHVNGQFRIRIVRRHKTAQPPMASPPQSDIRYWTDAGWTPDANACRLFDSHAQAKAEGERLEIWKIVPQEWRG